VGTAAGHDETAREQRSPHETAGCYHKNAQTVNSKSWHKATRPRAHGYCARPHSSGSFAEEQDSVHSRIRSPHKARRHRGFR